MFLFAFVLTLALEDGTHFAEFVEEETEHLCERRFDGSIGCWPGGVERSDGVFGSILVDSEAERLQVVFPDGTVDGIPEESRICEFLWHGLVCHDTQDANVDQEE